MKIYLTFLLLLLFVFTSCSVTETTPVVVYEETRALETEEVSLTSCDSLFFGKTYAEDSVEVKEELFLKTKVILPILPTDELNECLRISVSGFVENLDYPFAPKYIDFYFDDYFASRTFTFYISDSSKLFNESKLYFSYNTLENTLSSTDDFLDRKTKKQFLGDRDENKVVVTESGIYVSTDDEEIFIDSKFFSKEKFISVFHPEFYEPVSQSDDKYVALTFDDGPNPYTTPLLLDILEERGVKATFFMVGINVDAYRSTVKKVFDGGHDIGLHSYRHANYDLMDGEEVMDDLDRCSDLMYSIIKKRPYLVRPPYGNIDTEKIENDTYFFVNWNVDPLDWKTESAEEIAKNVLDCVKNGSIILLHDIYSASCEAAGIIIDKLKDDGYRFVTISEYYDLNGKKTDNKLHFLHGDYYEQKN